VELAGVGRTIYQAFDDRAADAACSYLEEQAGRKGGRPFAAVAGFLLPHCPFVAPVELFDYYYERVDVPQPSWEEREREPRAIGRFKEIRDIDRPLPEERIRVARAAYFGMCEYFDQLVGRVLKKLEETGLNRNTLVVYCSDHGEMAGEHG
jgi:choline-sulfatase